MMGSFCRLAPAASPLGVFVKLPVNNREAPRHHQQAGQDTCRCNEKQILEDSLRDEDEKIADCHRYPDPVRDIAILQWGEDLGVGVAEDQRRGKRGSDDYVM